MNLLWFSITGLCYMLILFLITWNKDFQNSIQKKIFKTIMIVNSLGLICQIMLMIFILLSSRYWALVFGKVVLSYNIIYLIIVTIYITCLCFQNVEEEDYKLKSKLKPFKIAGVVLGIISILIVGLLNTEIESYNNMTIISGYSLTYTMIFIIFCLIVWISLLIIFYKKLLSSQKILPIFIVIVIGAIITILLNLDDNYVLFTGLNTISIYFLYSLIEAKQPGEINVSGDSKTSNENIIPDELKEFLDEESKVDSSSIINNSFNEEDFTKEIPKTKHDEKVPTIDLSDKKILMVDDNEFNLKIGIKILKSYHAQVSTLSSGIDCIKEIKKGKKYDLIFMDDMMPNMSGVETLQKLLHEIDNFNVPVIALTANTAEGMKDKYISYGFTDYLTKPIIKVELNDALIKVFNLAIDIPVEEHVSEQTNEYTSLSAINYLRNKGIDIDIGIELLGDYNMYQEMMDEFLKVIRQRLKDLKKYKDSKDLKNYAIQVHSLKSDSKYLGFQKLATMALEHEKMSKENNLKYINSHYGDLAKETNGIILVCEEFKKKFNTN